MINDVKTGRTTSQMSYILDGFQYSWFNSPVTELQPKPIIKGDSVVGNERKRSREAQSSHSREKKKVQSLIFFLSDTDEYLTNRRPPSARHR